MDYTLSLTRHAHETLTAHLLGDRSREQMAITLCGVQRRYREVRLLVRDVILLPPETFRRQSNVALELKPDVQAFIHQRAHQHGLIEVDWHSHPGSHTAPHFSATDDYHEAAQAAYLAARMDGVPYGSVVVNDQALDGRLWLTRELGQAGDGPAKVYRPEAQPLKTIFTGDLQHRIPASVQAARTITDPATARIFDRQVRAFGQAFQRKLGDLRVGVVGVGGLGSAIVANLARLGVRDWVLVDPDTVEPSNLNRLVNATTTDAYKARPKVNVARSTIYQVRPRATVRALQCDVFAHKALHALKHCDLLIVATDNHSTRMLLNRLAVQYLIPLVHVGFNISVTQAEGQPATVTDVSGEFAIPDLGRWCLHCAGIIDPQQVAWELASPHQQRVLRERGYVKNTPAPAVHHLDSLVAALATAEIHNLVHAYKPRQRYLVYDALRTELLPLQVNPSDTCPVCSPDHGILGLGDLEPLPDYRRAARVQLPPVSGLPRTKDAKAAAAHEQDVATLPPTGDAASPSPSSEPDGNAVPEATFHLATPVPPDGYPLPQSRHFERARRRQQALVVDDEHLPWG